MDSLENWKWKKNCYYLKGRLAEWTELEGEDWEELLKSVYFLNSNIGRA